MKTNSLDLDIKQFVAIWWIEILHTFELINSMATECVRMIYKFYLLYDHQDLWMWLLFSLLQSVLSALISISPSLASSLLSQTLSTSSPSPSYSLKKSNIRFYILQFFIQVAVVMSSINLSFVIKNFNNVTLNTTINLDGKTIYKNHFVSVWNFWNYTLSNVVEIILHWKEIWAY